MHLSLVILLPPPPPPVNVQVGLASRVRVPLLDNPSINAWVNIFRWDNPFDSQERCCRARREIASCPYPSLISPRLKFLPSGISFAPSAPPPL